MGSLGDLSTFGHPDVKVFWTAQLDRTSQIDRMAIAMRAEMLGDRAEPWDESSGHQRDAWRRYARAGMNALRTASP